MEGGFEYFKKDLTDKEKEQVRGVADDAENIFEDNNAQEKVVADVVADKLNRRNSKDKEWIAELQDTTYETLTDLKTSLDEQEFRVEELFKSLTNAKARFDRIQNQLITTDKIDYNNPRVAHQVEMSNRILDEIDALESKYDFLADQTEKLRELVGNMESTVFIKTDYLMDNKGRKTDIQTDLN